jgi:phosphohistidine swiveling domain-containing protein
MTRVRVLGKVFTGQTIEVKNHKLIVDNIVVLTITDKDIVEVLEGKLTMDTFDF